MHSSPVHHSLMRKQFNQILNVLDFLFQSHICFIHVRILSRPSDDSAGCALPQLCKTHAIIFTFRDSLHFLLCLNNCSLSLCLLYWNLTGSLFTYKTTINNLQHPALLCSMHLFLFLFHLIICFTSQTKQIAFVYLIVHQRPRDTELVFVKQTNCCELMLSLLL